MLRVVAAVLACLCVARCSRADPYSLRAYTQSPKDLSNILTSIEERLRVLDTISAAQETQARRLDFIESKLDRVENTLTLKLDRAQLAAEKLEHRLHMLQTNVQASIKDSSEKLEKNQMKTAEQTQNLTDHVLTHTHLLEQVNNAYADIWRRSLVLESLVRDGLSLVNVTRRELADGLRSLARRQRDARINPGDLETIFTRRLNENTNKIDNKMQELLDAQNSFIDSCQQVQQDDPQPVTDVLDKLIESLLKLKTSTFHELHKIQENINKHDTKVVKILNTQADMTCRRLETAFRNTSHTILKEHELRQLTEKFVSLTDRADEALQRLEAQLKVEDTPTVSAEDEGIRNPKDMRWIQGQNRGTDGESREYYDSEDESDRYYNDERGDDIMGEDQIILSRGWKKKSRITTVRPPHRRHLHKHPYDRGPTAKSP